MKTPLQELIEHIETNHAYFLEFGTEDCPVKVIRNKAIELLEKERQMVVDAVNSNKGLNGWRDGEKYFNEKFEK